MISKPSMHVDRDFLAGVGCGRLSTIDLLGHEKCACRLKMDLTLGIVHEGPERATQGQMESSMFAFSLFSLCIYLINWRRTDG